MRIQSLLYPVVTISILLFGVGCQTIDQPKETSEGYSSFRFIKNAVADDSRFEAPSPPRNQTTQAAVTEVFESNGLVLDADNADLIVAYLFIRQDNVSTMAIPTYYGADYTKIQKAAHKQGVLKNTSRDFFEVGAIVVDIIEAESGELIYRNYAKRDIQGLTEPADFQPLIKSAVQEALDLFFE